MVPNKINDNDKKSIYLGLGLSVYLSITAALMR